MILLRSDFHAQMNMLAVCIPYPFSLAHLVATDLTLASGGILVATTRELLSLIRVSVGKLSVLVLTPTYSGYRPRR